MASRPKTHQRSAAGLPIREKTHGGLGDDCVERQSGYQLRTKGIYCDFGGILHASIHALATPPVFLLFRRAMVTALAIVASEIFAPIPYRLA
jgi:hypothetical protein